jgi:opacity protein-like surface antigen
MIMRLSLVAMGVVVMLASAGQAVASSGERPQGQAIQFGIGSSFSVSQFSGATIGYQRSLSENVTWRLSMTLDLNYTSVDQADVGTGDAEMDESVDLEEWSHYLSASSEWFVSRGAPVSVYFGGGPRIAYSTRQDDRADFRSGDPVVEYRDTRRVSALSAGASGLLGVQWAPSDWFALHAEYRLSALYVRRTEGTWTSRSGDDGYFLEETLTWNGVTIDSEGVRVGFSVYF